MSDCEGVHCRSSSSRRASEGDSSQLSLTGVTGNKFKERVQEQERIAGPFKIKAEQDSLMHAAAVAAGTLASACETRSQGG